jgi:hypothetical protein
MPAGQFIPTRLTDLTADVALTTPARGDVLYRGASKWNNLAAGTSGRFLKTQGAGADPVWADVPSGSPGGSSGQVQYNSGGSFAGAAAVTYATSGSLLTVTAQAAADVPLTAAGTTSQSGLLLKCADVSGNTVGSVSVAGLMTLGRAFVNSGCGITLGSGGTITTSDGGLKLNALRVLENGGVNLLQTNGPGVDFGITPAPRQNDTAPAKMHVRGADAWDNATLNKDGGPVRVYGGGSSADAGGAGGLRGNVVLGYDGAAAFGNVSLFGDGSFGGGKNVVFLANAGTDPTTNPTGGGILFCSGGALKYRGSGGTVTTLGAA